MGTMPGLGRDAAAPPVGPLELAAIARAAHALRPARRAERIAGMSGWLTLLAGALSLPFAMGSGVGLVLSGALVVVGVRELRLRSGLRRLEAIAGGRLCRNQIMLGVALAAYAGLRLSEGPGTLASLGAADLEQAPELAAAAEGVARLAHYGLYLGMIVGAMVVQGSQAAYYASVGRCLARAWAGHPAWVMRVHAAAWTGMMPEVGAGAASTPDTLDQGSQKNAA